MNKIAIKGHLHKGKEIIKILKSLGGINKANYIGTNTSLWYFINTNGYITSEFFEHIPKDYKKYTLKKYIQKSLNNMETKRNIQIDLTTAKEWYKQGGNLKEIALQAFSEKELKSLPAS